MLFKCQEVGQEVASSYVVVDPRHVCHFVLQAILSPRKFKQSNLVFPSHGVIEGPELDKALVDAGVDPKAGKGLLHFSQVCTPNPFPPDSHFFGIHVSARSGTWKDDGVTKPQCGLQVHCPNIPFSPAFLPALLLALCNKTGGINEDSLVWRTGVVLPWENHVTVKVSIAELVKIDLEKLIYLVAFKLIFLFLQQKCSQCFHNSCLKRTQVKQWLLQKQKLPFSKGSCFHCRLFIS